MPLSRRRFLEDSLLAASATILTAKFPVESSAGEAPCTASASPNEQIHLAVCGLNGRGAAHIDGYIKQPDALIVALCDVNLDIANRRADEVEKKGKPRPLVYQDLRKLYEDKQIDAVSMALPIHWHSLAAIWAMQAGKDVYVEKPVCHNLYEGQRLVETAQKYQRICQAGTQSRSHKACRDAMDYIHSGKIGKVVLARGLCYKPRGSIGIQPDSPVPDGLDYDIWLGPAPKRPFNKNRYLYNWHWNWDYGAGDLGNQGIHQMDIARWALGKDRLPNRVMGLGGRFGYVDQGETPNTELAFYDYGDAHLTFEVRGLPTGPYWGAKIGNIIYGTQGYVVFTDSYGTAAAYDNDGHPVMKFSGGGDHFRNYLDAVRSRDASQLHAPVHEGYLSSALCHLGNISYRVGSPADSIPRPVQADKESLDAYRRFTYHLEENGVSLKGTPCRFGRLLDLDPKSQTFRNDSEANALLTRNYRAPFVIPEKV
jgi:predicted dehydrogenase